MKKLLIAFLLMQSMMLSGCDALSAALATPTPVPTARQLIVGRWERVTARKPTPPFALLMPDSLEFLADGSWVVPGSGFLNGKYSFQEASKIKIEGFSAVVFTPEVTITPSGGSMVLSEAGERVEYRRK